MIKEKNFLGEVVVDTMDNEVLDRYDCHPERICIIHDGRIVHDGGNNKFAAYDIEDVIRWLYQRDTREKKQTAVVPETDALDAGEEQECAAWQ